MVIAAFDGVELLDITGPAAVFSSARRLCLSRGEPAPYEVSLVGLRRRVRSSEFTVETKSPAELARPIDTFLVGGAFELIEQAPDGDVLELCRGLCQGARRVGSICTGAFVLAELGLLKKRRATTHWLASGAMRRRFPSIELMQDALYVKDGRYYTSAGVSAGIDLALALVEEDLGHSLALEIARLLVVFLHRPGGQSQFSAVLRHQASDDDRIRKLQLEIAERPAADLSISALARRVAMSERNFVRVFTVQTGISPGSFVRRSRLEAAQRALEQTHNDLEAVATSCGFHSAEVLRRGFLSEFGVTPSAYRDRFRSRAERR